MSRYSHVIEVVSLDTNPPKKFRVAYGYDEPLSGFFIEVWAMDDEDEPLIEEDTFLIKTPLSKMLSLFILFGVPEKFTESFSKNEPF